MKLTVVLCSLMMALFGAACSSTSERPTGELANAQSSITLAEQNGAQRFSVAELTKAREKLNQANRYVEQGEHEAAKRLAAEAELDARLAAATATLRRNEMAEDEVNSVLNALESEVRSDQ